MDEEEREKYIEAGEIAQGARKKARELASPETKIIDIAEEIENYIRNKGAKPAFPVNISVNETSAHYTPKKDTERELKRGDVVKIDIGAHIDGYIADTALSINPDGSQNELIKATQEALEAGIEEANPGKEIGKIGELIQNKIESKGFKPVRNLGGHYLERWVQHAGERIPNIRTSNVTKLKEGDAIAIEPFATKGSGKVKETSPGNIYKYSGGKTRRRTERKVLGIIKNEFNTLPFTPRWIDLPESKLEIAIRNLVNKDVLHSYPILKEVDGKKVSQSEHTLIVGKEQKVTTRE